MWLTFSLSVCAVCGAQSEAAEPQPVQLPLTEPKDDNKDGKNGSQGSRKVASTGTLPLWIRRRLYRRSRRRRPPRVRAWLCLYVLFLSQCANFSYATPARHHVHFQVGGQSKA